MTSTTYILVSTLVMAFIGLMWSSKTLPNALIKFILIGVAVWGLLEYLALVGFIVRKGAP